MFKFTTEDIMASSNPAWKRALQDASGAPAVAEVVKAAPAHTPGRMNKTEARYARRLDGMKPATVLSYRFEAVTLVLDDPDQGRRTRYTPDFRVVHVGGAVSFDEIKGAFIRETGMLKFKWACEQWPEFWFRMWQWKGGAWELLRENGGVTLPHCPGCRPGRRGDSTHIEKTREHP